MFVKWKPFYCSWNQNMKIGVLYKHMLLVVVFLFYLSILTHCRTALLSFSPIPVQAFQWPMFDREVQLILKSLFKRVDKLLAIRGTLCQRPSSILACGRCVQPSSILVAVTTFNILSRFYFMPFARTKWLLGEVRCNRFISSNIISILQTQHVTAKWLCRYIVHWSQNKFVLIKK